MRAYRTLAVSLCLATTGCAGLPLDWVGADGQPADPNQLQIAETICRGDVQKATQGRAVGASDFMTGPNRQDQIIYNSCMAEFGYKAQ
jgi:hypothetical protein